MPENFKATVERLEGRIEMLKREVRDASRRLEADKRHRDALEIELELKQGVKLPDEWQQADAPAGGLDITILVHDTKDGLVAHFKIPADDSCWLLLPTRIGAGKVDLTRSSMSYGLVEGDELWLVNKKPAGF